MRGRRNTVLSTSSTGSSCLDASIVEKGHSISPPASPRTPSPSLLLLRSDGPNADHRRRRFLWTFKILCIVFGLLLLVRCVRTFRSELHAGPEVSDSAFHLPGAPKDLPDQPAAVSLTASQWTISIPHDLAFPLPAETYKDLCRKGSAMGAAIAQSSRTTCTKWTWWRRQGNPRSASGYLDIADAEKARLLPKSAEGDASGICESSLTFVLEADDVGFGNSLLQLWLSYGQAQSEGRAFFIDDSRWAWGQYSSYFLPPPTPACKPPPAHHIVPCPYTAKHLVVASKTLPWIFGDNIQHDRVWQKRIYDLLRAGYEALFHLNEDDAVYVSSHIASLHTSQGSFPASTGVPIVGMHIRRGDLHPLEFQYNRDYLPLERYADAALALAAPSSSWSSQKAVPLILAASDDPDIVASAELAHLNIAPAQERILLATQSTLDRARPRAVALPSSSYRKQADENAGWDGGFYAAMFGSVVPEVRTLVGRAYAIDLAVLAHAGAQEGGVVCAVSAAGCRALGVAVGWERLRKGFWVNVDDGRAWSWNVLEY